MGRQDLAHTVWFTDVVRFTVLHFFFYLFRSNLIFPKISRFPTFPALIGRSTPRRLERSRMFLRASRRRNQPRVERSHRTQRHRCSDAVLLADVTEQLRFIPVHCTV